MTDIIKTGQWSNKEQREGHKERLKNINKDFGFDKGQADNIIYKVKQFIKNIL